MTAPNEDRAVAVELGPVIVADAPAPAAPRAAPAPVPQARGEEEDDADPQEVRRRIASASRSFDPDHQIRRAMDAFLSPSAVGEDRPTPDH